MNLIQILLPVYDNAGKALDRALYAKVREELISEFGGLTTYSRAPATGLWAETRDEVVKDDIVVYEVMVPALDRGWWARYRRRLETRFAQEEVVIRAMAVEKL
ncbi:hypothetical protein FN976_01205 [Caenimonas sedimenti]|uniref:DUF1330 domain-containing protein n=1 Tax=Caenimonas sedimenti TaxID=2596921 RepID=A0A562ZW92_9BURK|nr:hypothetical protein [Caenimonas sedimenti]TWO72889.1 hypothetical protein FN976_01205 [Caenimonas sedimenti]